MTLFLPALKHLYSKPSVVKRFEPTNTEKLVSFYKKHDSSKTQGEIEKILGKLDPKDTNSLEKLMSGLKSKYGDTPFLFFDDQLAIDAVAGENIEVYGPEMGL